MSIFYLRICSLAIFQLYQKLNHVWDDAKYTYSAKFKIRVNILD